MSEVPTGTGAVPPEALLEHTPAPTGALVEAAAIAEWLTAAVHGEAVSEFAESFQAVRDAMDLRAERDALAAENAVLTAELQEANAELDKHGAPAGANVRARVRALVVDARKVNESIISAGQEAVAKARATPERTLPPERSGMTCKITIAGMHDLYVTVNMFDDGKPGEIFLKMAKQGSTLSGLLDAVAMSVSRGLKQGVPLAWYCYKFQNLRFDPAGATGDSKMPFVSSPLDAAFKWLARRFPAEVEYPPIEGSDK